jgi:hypothetical protein
MTFRHDPRWLGGEMGFNRNESFLRMCESWDTS